MARTSEKAAATLNRLLTAQRNIAFGDPSKKQRRPHLASLVNSLSEAEKWRKTVLYEISRTVTTIQNGSLGEATIRDLNDEINKLLRERRHWEKQIKVLGGKDYTNEWKINDLSGTSALYVDGYFYFGAAKDLPGIREMYESKIKQKSQQQITDALKRKTLYEAIDTTYYGWTDEQDEHLLMQETEWENKHINKYQRSNQTNVEQQIENTVHSTICLSLLTPMT